MMFGDPRLSVRFWSKVSIAETGCWLWTAATDSSGYGCFGVNRRVCTAHRVSYEAFKGQVPDGLQLDHLCRVIRCVNPDHLEPVTGLVNMQRRFASYTRCAKGHEFSSDNTYIRASGRRDCRACIRDRAKRYKARRRARQGGVA